MDRVELRGSRGRGIEIRQAEVRRGRSDSLQRADDAAKMNPSRSVQMFQRKPKKFELTFLSRPTRYPFARPTTT